MSSFRLNNGRFLREGIMMNLRWSTLFLRSKKLVELIHLEIRNSMAPKTLTIARDIELQLTTKPLSTIPKNRMKTFMSAWIQNLSRLDRDPLDRMFCRVDS
ncbi:unnamed protein product [Albugo candida]|uniref:Uncharacterized protein n=1 Tax=Albugo candida TaxID=65357 RepID=A0A024FVH1_9STRA|nr:unnamed protein product [Albugo candida]|eukprot:CCI10912.1 unnamed protein product [Albugo candida]